MAQKSDQRPETQNFAVMSVPDLVAAIEHAGFTCEGSGLGKFIPWQALKARILTKTV
jgi:hypothetical protein